MKHIFIIIFVLFLTSCAHKESAAVNYETEFKSGQIAFSDKNFELAFKIWKPLSDMNYRDAQMAL